MNKKEHLFTCLAEEAAEVSQRVSKALRFGLSETQAGQMLSNDDRIVQEIQDFISVAEILYREGLIRPYMPNENQILAKNSKIQKYMKISKEQGVLQRPPRQRIGRC